MKLKSDYTVSKRCIRGLTLIYSDTGNRTLKTYYNYNAHDDVTQLVNYENNEWKVTRTYKFDSFGNQLNVENLEKSV